MPPTTTSALRGVRPELLGALLDMDPTDPMWVRPAADRIFIPTQVPGQSGDYGRVKREPMLRLTDSGGKRKDNAHTQEIDLELDSLFYSTEEHAFKSFISERTKARYKQLFGGTLTLEVARSKLLYGQLLREREARAAALVQNVTTFPQSGNTGLDIVNEWDDAANADPIGDVATGIAGVYARTGMRPNKLQVHWLSLLDIARTDQVVERFKYTSQTLNAGRPTPQDIDQLASGIAPVLGVDEIIVPFMPKNTADKGQTFAGGDVWDREYAFLFYGVDSPDPAVPNAGRLFFYEDNGGLLQVRSWESDDPKGDYLAVQDETELKFVDTSFGFLFSDCYTAA